MGKKLRIGFDVDSIHANWSKTFTITANRLSPVFPVMEDDSKVLDWRYKFYFKGKDIYVDGNLVDFPFVRKVMHETPNSFENMEPLNKEHLDWLAGIIEKYPDIVEVVMVTARNSKVLSNEELHSQTFNWYEKHGIKDPKVYLRRDKGDAARELELDFFIDDSPENVRDVLEKSPGTRAYLLRLPFNEQEAKNGLSRVALNSLDDYHKIIEEEIRKLTKSINENDNER